MVKDDSDYSRGVLFEGPGFVDCRHLAVLIGKMQLAHREGEITVDKDARVFRFKLAPTFQGKAGIFRISFVAFNKIR